MARKARLKSATGIYHILIRGVVEIFRDSEDLDVYEGVLKDLQDEGRGVFYAYALCRDYVFIVAGETDEAIGTLVKRICVRYFDHYSMKYAYSGNMYIDRFRSMPVETAGYLESVLDVMRGCGYLRYREGDDMPVLCSDGHQDGMKVLEFVERPLRITTKALVDYLVREFGFTTKEEFKSRPLGERKKVIVGAKKVGASASQFMDVLGWKYRLVEWMKGE